MKHIEPESSRIAKLTAKQRECLHLVVLRKSSLEIARILKISKSAVDQRLVSARQVLGASTRAEAALIYGKASVVDRISCDPAGAISNSNPDVRASQSELSNPSGFDEVSLAYDMDAERDSNGLPQILTGAKGDWGVPQRIAILIILAIGFVAIVLIGLSVSQSLSRLLMA